MASQIDVERGEGVIGQMELTARQKQETKSGQKPELLVVTQNRACAHKRIMRPNTATLGIWTA